jgi:hypothetical protein
MPGRSPTFNSFTLDPTTDGVLSLSVGGTEKRKEARPGNPWVIGTLSAGIE